MAIQVEKQFGIPRGVLSTCCLTLPLLIAGCGPSSSGTVTATTSKTEGAKPSLRSQVRIALIQDKSLSTGETRTPELTLDNMEPLVELLGQTGGELAVGTIDNRSNRCMVRLHIDAGPDEPLAPPAADNSLERWQQQNELRKRKAAFEQQQQAWQGAMQERIAVFQTAVEPILSAPANAQHSPVWDAVRRADLFLSEPQGAASEPHRYVVLITDGMDDVGAQPVPVHTGTRILMVNGSGQLGSLAVLRPQRYESIEAAISQIAALEGQQ